MGAVRVIGLLDSDDDSITSYNSDNVELLQLSASTEDISSPQKDSSMVSQREYSVNSQLNVTVPMIC